MTTKTTDKQRRAALYAATQAERTAQMNLRTASINRAWHEMKLKHPDAILLFRVGDLYEIYGEDAKAASDTLGLTLCRRNVGGNVGGNGGGNGGNDVEKTISLCGFPYHALDSYLPKLVLAGFRVAITEEFAEITPPTRPAWEDTAK